MGCDIHVFVEKRGPHFWDYVPNLKPFDNRDYAVFAFLGDVRNYSKIPALASNRGFPSDLSSFVKENTTNSSFFNCDGHSPSWVSLQELLNFDYDKVIEDRRVTVQLGPNFWSGAGTCEEGEGTKTTYREYLDEWFFKDLEELKKIGLPEDVRVIFFFDN